jgi:hypothetical protein
MEEPKGRQTGGDISERPETGTHYLANTNLLKVSDWLTTILIGLGLVQLGRLIPAIGDLADALEAPLGGTSTAGTFGVTVVIGSVITGAILAYLWTSVRVRQLFEESERECAKTVTQWAEARQLLRRSQNADSDRGRQPGAAEIEMPTST